MAKSAQRANCHTGHAYIRRSRRSKGRQEKVICRYKRIVSTFCLLYHLFQSYLYMLFLYKSRFQAEFFFSSYIFVFFKENILYRIESTNANFTIYFTSIYRCYFYRSRFQAGMPQIQKGKYFFPLFLCFLKRHSVKFLSFL